MFLLVGESVRSLMESAAVSGYKVMGVDYFGDVDALWHGNIISLADLGQKQTVENLLKIAKTIPCCGLVYGSGLENAPEELEFWEKRGLLRGNGRSVLIKVRDPWKLRQCLENINVCMPPFLSVEEWREKVKNGRWIIKALNREGGHGIVEMPEKMDNATYLLLKLNNFNFSQYVIQEYMEGISSSVTFLANGQDAVVLGTSRQLIGKGRGDRLFIYEGNIVPLDVKGIIDFKDFSMKINQIVKYLTLYFGLKGINTMDFILNSKGIWILEVNPRWSGSVELIEKSLGINLFEYHLIGCRGEKLPQFLQMRVPIGTDSICHTSDNKDIQQFIGKTLVYAESAMAIGDIKEKEFRYLYDQGVRDMPRAETIIEKDQPICTVLAKGSGDEDCLLKLKEKSQLLHQFLGQIGNTVEC